MSRNDFVKPSYEENVGRLVSIYKNALLRLQKELDAVDITKLNSASTYALIRNLQEELLLVDKEAVEWVNENLLIASKDGIANSLVALEYVDSYEEALKVVKFNQANAFMVRKAVQDTYKDVLGITKNMNDNFVSEIRKISADVIAENIAMNNKVQLRSKEMAKRIKELQDRLRDSVDVAIVDAGKRKWAVEHYTEMLARTKMMQIHDEACSNEAIGRGAYYATISFNASTKDACRHHQGRIVKLVNEAEGNYPTVDQLKMSGQIFHPNCKHFILPLRDPSLLSEWERSLAEKQQAIGDKALEAGGRNPKDIENVKK
ncbi:phage minor capsid protein [Bacillus sp. SN10]|uniref:phage minor capsid protein n=1 Tax=Bacillus sp. SN10 TaxID=2056493 RepID=UPI000C347115|nr:phage minor capsid protein [Bacillus sp. SN10]PKJ52709.1 minor capsid protein [Bacillus sp. SN10]